MRRQWDLFRFLAVGLSMTSGMSTAAIRAPYASAPVVINEIAAGTGGFIELYNSSASPYDLNGHCVVYRSSSATTDGTPLVTFSKSTVVPSHGYYLLTASAYTGGAGDVSYSRALSQTGGLVVLRKGAPDKGSVLDAVAYGTGKNPFFTTAPAPALTPAGSLARSPNGANTLSNSGDFKLTTQRTPKAANP